MSGDDEASSLQSTGGEVEADQADRTRAIRVSVTKLSGEPIGDFDALVSDTVAHFKRQVLAVLLSKGAQLLEVGLSLVHGGTVLPNESCLIDAGIDDGAVMQLVIRPHERFIIAARVRPLRQSESLPGRVALSEAKGSSLVVKWEGASGEPRESRATFDVVYSESAGQKEVFEGTVRGVVDSFLAGLSGTVMVYGRSETGKTHTMIGSGCAPGMMIQAFDHIEARIREAPPRTTFVVRASAMQILSKKRAHERAHELAAVEPRVTWLQLGQGTREGVLVEGLSACVARSAQDLHQALTTALALRRVHATRDFIFTVQLDSYEHFEQGAVLHSRSKLTMVDPRVPAALSSCLRALAKRTETGAAQQIPHNHSGLSLLLKESLGGRARMAMIITCSPTTAADETASTFRFVNMASQATNFPEVSQSREVLSTEQLAEIEKLRWPSSAAGS